MGIGTSLGAFFHDEHHYNASLWDPNRFEGDQLMEKTPNNMYTDKDLDKAELDPTTGLGLEVGYKSPIPWGQDEKTYGNVIDRRDNKGVYTDVRDATSMPVTARAMEFFGVRSDLLDTNLPPHTGEPLKKDLGYNDIRKPTKEEVEAFRHNVENMNSSADPFTEAQPADSIGQMIDKIEKKTYYKSKYGSITDDDIDKAINIGLSASGGGLKTEAVETVGKAALKFGKDIFEGANHGLALDKLMAKFGGGDKIDFGKVADGFMTSKGRFVSREEAMTIARKNNQLVDKELHPSTTGLLSEDLVK